MRLLLPWIVSPLLAASAFAQDPALSSQALSTGNRADDLTAADVNGDGYPDLVVQSGLDLRFFLFRAAEGFRKDADFSLRLDPRTFLWTMAKFCDADLPAVAAASSRGIHRYPPANGSFSPKPQDLVVHPSIFEGELAPGRGPLRLDFMRDLTGDGLPDAVLFQRGEILILPQERARDGSPQFRLEQKLDVPIDAGLTMYFGPHQRVREVTSVPVLAFGDFNGDKRVDISYYQDDVIGTYFQQPDGRFAVQDPLAVGEKRKPRATYLKFEVPPQIVDLNGDGMLDVVVVYASKGRAHVFLNRGGKFDFSNPDAVLKAADGWSSGVYIRDLDGDGKQEIVMGFIRKFGIIGGIDVFISKKIEVELHIFHWSDQQSNFPNEPVQQLTFRIPYIVQATRESASVDVTFRPNFDADLNGDGRYDLIVENEEDPRVLDVYYGEPDRVIADKPGGVIRLTPPENTVTTFLTAADFNNDRKSDLVIRYLLLGKEKTEVEVRLSK